MNIATIEFLLFFTASLLFLLIFLALYYLWNKTAEIEAITRKSVKTMTRLSGGTLLGLMGKEIWEALSSAKLPEDRREELEKALSIFFSDISKGFWNRECLIIVREKRNPKLRRGDWGNKGRGPVLDPSEIH